MSGKKTKTPKMDKKFARKQYTKVMVDPVQLWMGKSSPLLHLSREDRILLPTPFTQAIFEKVASCHIIALLENPDLGPCV